MDVDSPGESTASLIRALQLPAVILGARSLTEQENTELEALEVMSAPRGGQGHG